MGHSWEARASRGQDWCRRRGGRGEGGDKISEKVKEQRAAEPGGSWIMVEVKWGDMCTGMIGRGMSGMWAYGRKETGVWEGLVRQDKRPGIQSEVELLRFHQPWIITPFQLFPSLFCWIFKTHNLKNSSLCFFIYPHSNPMRGKQNGISVCHSHSKQNIFTTSPLLFHKDFC